MNNTNVPGPGAFLKMISIIHLALLTGMLLFAVISFIKNGNTEIKTDAADPFFIVVPFMVIAGFLLSNFMFRKNLANAISAVGLRDKLALYQTASIIRYALLEGPALFGIVVYMLTGNLLYLLIVGALIGYFVTIRPQKDKIAEQLELTYEEKLEL